MNQHIQIKCNCHERLKIIKKRILEERDKWLEGTEMNNVLESMLKV